MAKRFNVSTANGGLYKAWKVVYRTADGRAVPKGTPGAVRKEVLSRKWYVRLKAAGGWTQFPLAADPQVARQMAAELARRLERRAAGLDDPADGTMTAPLKGHVDGYLQSLRLAGDTPRYVAQTRRELVRAAKWCRDGSLAGLSFPRDPDADRVADALLSALTLADLRAERVDAFLASGAAGRSAATKNRYRRALVGLGNHLVAKRRLVANPFAAARAGGVKVVRRRALPPGDLDRLVRAAEGRPAAVAAVVRRGPRAGTAGVLKPAYRARLERAGRQRALVYLTAAYTGLRYGTLSRVRVGHLDLIPEGERWDIPGDLFKSGRPYREPVRADLAERLRAWVGQEGKGPADRLFDLPAASMVRELKKDLKAAGIPYLDGHGRRFDFHAFRTCTGTYLRMSKADPAVAMRVLDHTDIRLTMQVYSDGEMLDVRAALNSLPSLTG